MPIEYQGSMTLSVGSHKVPWRFEAYEAIGQNRTLDGGLTKQQIVKKREEKRKLGRTSIGACEINVTRPDLREKLNARATILDLRKGDVIFHTRVLFHKTTDATEEGVRYYESQGITNLNRYSIRYTPGSAKLPNGWMAEWSAVSNPDNVGRSLDDVTNIDGTTWYPKVWPSSEHDLPERLNDIAANKLKRAKELVMADMIELFSPLPKIETKEPVEEQEPRNE